MVSKKLGQILIDRGAITNEQLEAALRNQLMLGGHLGTCLLELGFVDEGKLGDALAAATRAPYAKPEVFRRVQPIALRSLPRRLVEEYQAVPFRWVDKVLDVAMINPRDLLAIDALSFASACRIVPWVSPEVRIFEAMERLYDVPRRMRHIVISRSLAPLPAAGKVDAERPEQSQEPEPSRSLDAQRAPSDASDHGAEYGYGRSWVEVAEELAARNQPLDDSSDHGAGSNLASQLCLADDKDTLARAVLEYALRTMKRAALFVVRDEALALWQGAGFEARLDPSAFGAVGIRGLALLDHLLGHDHYRGPLGDSEAHREIYARLGVPAPVEIVLVPVHVNDRLVALFLGDGGPEGRVHGDPREELRLARMLGLALNLIILKRKLRNLGSLAGHASD